MGLVKTGDSLLVRDGALATSTDCCCGGICSKCANPPGTVVLRMPMLIDWTDIFTAEQLNGISLAHRYRCWQVWSGGGCARCNELSESDQTLHQYPSHYGRNCSGDPSSVDCTGSPAGCDPIPPQDCHWYKLIPLCTIDEGYWFQGLERISCCGHEWDAFAGAGEPFAGLLPCDGWATGEACETTVDPNDFVRYCECGGCPGEGALMCGGGCCWFAFLLHVWIEDTGSQNVVGVQIIQLRRVGTEFAGSEYLLMSKAIDYEDWDCLTTPVEFFCEDTYPAMGGFGSFSMPCAWEWALWDEESFPDCRDFFGDTPILTVRRG